MARQYKKRTSRGARNLQSAGRSVLGFAGRTADNAACGLARWATTDHSGIGNTLDNMPSLGFFGGISYISSVVFSGILRMLMHVAVVFFTIAIWIPFLIYLVLKLI